MYGFSNKYCIHVVERMGYIRVLGMQWDGMGWNEKRREEERYSIYTHLPIDRVPTYPLNTTLTTKATQEPIQLPPYQRNPISTPPYLPR